MKGMKGIKECVNWLLNNPGERLEGNGIVMFDGNLQAFFLKSAEDLKWHSLDGDLFDMFNYGDWKPREKPVDVLTALENCKKTGQRYKGLDCENDVIAKNRYGHVCIYKLNEQSFEVGAYQLWVPYKPLGKGL